MTTIIGIDGALAATGLAVWRDGRVAVRTIHTSPELPHEERWRHIGSQIWPAIQEGQTLAVIEGVFAGTKVLRTALDLAMVQATIRVGLHRRGVPFAIVDPQAPKQYACGVGRASKAEMVAATSRLRLAFHVGDDHQADALWEVAMAADWYGQPMCDTSDAGRKALARINWPKWTPDGGSA